MTKLITAFAAAAFALAASFAHAQTPPPGAGKGQMREGMRAAFEACKNQPDRRACMTQQMCAKASDPAKCQARIKEHGQHRQARIEKRQQMHEACNGKRGTNLTDCMKGQREQVKAERLEQRQKAHEACNAKRGEELTKCLREQMPRGMHHHRQRG